MAKKRTAVPGSTRDLVLREYNHRCAMCGGDRPQIHHIDGDPTNHESLNLLPLCPNCHLTDQHDPSAEADPAKLQLFRRYKDPAIMAPQFEPLFRRLTFLLSVDNAKDMDAVSQAADELVEFVRALEMGSFYAERIAKLIKEPVRFNVWTPNTPEEEYRSDRAKHLEKYRQALIGGRNEVYRLGVEMLRYQSWSSKTPFPKGAT